MNGKGSALRRAFAFFGWLCTLGSMAYFKINAVDCKSFNRCGVTFTKFPIVVKAAGKAEDMFRREMERDEDSARLYVEELEKLPSGVIKHSAAGAWEGVTVYAPKVHKHKSSKKTEAPADGDPASHNTDG